MSDVLSHLRDSRPPGDGALLPQRLQPLHPCRDAVRPRAPGPARDLAGMTVKPA